MKKVVEDALPDRMVKQAVKTLAWALDDEDGLRSDDKRKDYEDLAALVLGAALVGYEVVER